MRRCNNCGKTHGPLKRYMWNINHNFDSHEVGKTQRKSKPVLKSEQGLLCDACAKKKGAWQTQGQEEVPSLQIEVFEDVNEIIDTPEDIERLEREEKYSSLN